MITPDRVLDRRLPRIRSLEDLPPAARRRILRTVCRWEGLEYGAQQSRRLAAIEARLRHNHEGLLCAFDRDRLLGFGDVVPLAPSHYAALRRGRVVEEQIPSRWVGRGRGNASRCWYIGSLIVERALRASHPGLAHEVSARLQHAIWSHIAVRGRPPFRVLGISATPVGRAKFRQTGFGPVDPAADAVDLRPRFEQVFIRRAQLATRLGPRP